MKNTIIILIVIIFILLIIYAKSPSDQKNQINKLNKEIFKLRAKKDSLNNVLILTKDSLKIAIYTLEIKQEESKKAKEETLRIKKQYEKIHYISFPNDSVRSRELSRLYPSY